MRVLTLNVCGIRASQKKGLYQWLKRQKADYICLQEVRASEDQIDSDLFALNGYTRYSSVAEKKGYSGVCIYTKHKPNNTYNDFGSDFFSKEGIIRTNISHNGWFKEISLQTCSTKSNFSILKKIRTLQNKSCE